MTKAVIASTALVLLGFFISAANAFYGFMSFFIQLGSK
jgi:hypothetical protein